MLVNLFINVLLIIYIEKANARIRLKLYRKESNRFYCFIENSEFVEVYSYKI